MATVCSFALSRVFSILALSLSLINVTGFTIPFLTEEKQEEDEVRI